MDSNGRDRRSSPFSRRRRVLQRVLQLASDLGRSVTDPAELDDSPWSYGPELVGRGMPESDKRRPGPSRVRSSALPTPAAAVARRGPPGGAADQHRDALTSPFSPPAAT
jgi:hypothetical protein